MAFGVKVKLDVQVANGDKLRSQIQQAVENATQGKPLKIRHLSVDLGKQEAQRISKQLESALASQDITIKIGKIDASKPVANLKKQLTTMLSGLSITGLKDFLGTDGVADTYNKVAIAANRLAEAQENVRKKAETATVALKTLKNAQSTLNTAFKGISSIGDQEKIQEYLNTYHKLQAAIESAKAAESEAQSSEAANIAKNVVELNRQIAATLNEEKAIKRRTSAAKTQKQIDDERAAAANRAAKSEANNSRQVIQLRQRINSWIQNNTKAYKANQVEIDSIMSSLQNESEVSSVSLAQLKKRFEDVNASARAAGITGKSFFDTLQAGWEKFGGWSLVTKSMMAAYNAVKSMVNSVIELDGAMTELKKVTNLTSVEYSDFANQAAQTAKKIGASVADTVSATADFARLGYTVKEAALLAEAALVYKNVGDGIDDISEATESLISTMKAFGIEASESMSIVDMFNEVGNNFAISSSGIGEALQRSASALAAAGNTIEESIGLVTAMNSVVQDPDSVGTALKTLTMYLRAAKTEAEDAGIETDGMAESTAKLRSEIQALTGVDIMLDDDTFKSTYQILQEIADVWDNLTDVSRSNVLNLLGGKRNANVISSLITNFQDAEDAMKSAMGSLGSATAENEKYLDSIAGKIAVLKANWEELSSSVVNSGLIKVILDIATALTSVATGLSKIHLLLPAIAGISIFGGWVKGQKTLKNARDEIGELINSNKKFGEITDILSLKTDGMTQKQRAYLLEIIESTNAYEGFSDEQRKIIGSIINVNTASNVAATGVKRLGVAAKTAWSGLSLLSKATIILTVIELIVSGIDAIANSISESRQKMIEDANEIISTYEEAEKTVANNKKALEGLRNEFETLAVGVDANGQNVNLTASEYERYLSIIDQIVDISPNVVKGYDSERGALVNYKNVLDEAITLQDQMLENERRIKLAEGETVIGGLNSEMASARSEMDKWYSTFSEMLTERNNEIDAWFGTTKGYEGVFGVGGLLDTILGTRSLGGKYSIDGGIGDYYDNLIELYKRRDEVIAYVRSASVDSGKVDEDNNPIMIPLWSDEQIEELESRLDQIGVIYYKMLDAKDKVVDWYELWAEDRGLYEGIPENAYSEIREGIPDIYVPDDIDKSKANIRSFFLELQEAFSSEAAQNLSTMAEELKAGALSIGDYEEAVKSYILTFDPDSIILSTLSAYFYGLGAAVTSNVDAADNAQRSVASLSDALSRLQKGYDLLSKAKEDMADGGGLSVDTISSMVSMLEDGEKITDYLIYENGLVKLNEEAWRERSASMISGNIASLEKQIDDLRAENESLSSTPEDTWANSDEIDANTAAIAELNNELGIYRAIYGEIVNDSDDPLNLSSVISDLNEVGSKAKGLLSVLKELDNGTAMSAGEVANLALEYEELFGLSPDTYDLTTLEGQKAAIQAIIDAYEQEFDAIIGARIAELETAKTREGITDAEITAIDAKIQRLTTLKELSVSDIYSEEATATQTKRYGELEDAINGVSKASKLLTDIQSDENDPVSTLQSVIDILQDVEDLSLENFISGFSEMDGIDWNEDAIRGWSDALVNAVPGIDELETKFPGLKQYLKDLAVAEVEATNEAEKLKTAFENVSQALDFVSKLDSEDNDPLEMIQEAIELSKLVEGTDWTSWVSGFDKSGGTIVWNKETIRAFTDSLVDLIPNLNELEATCPGITEYLKEQAFATKEAQLAYDSLSNALSGVSKASELLTNIHTGSTDIIGMLETVVDMAETSGKNISEFFSVVDGEFTFKEDAATVYLDALIDKIGELPGVGNDAIEALRKVTKEQMEAAAASEVLSQAISGVKTASSLLTDIESGEGDMLDMLQTAADMAQQSGQRLNEFFTIAGTDIQWNKEAIIDWAGNLVDRLSQVVDIAPEVQAYLKGAIASEIEAATAAERMEKAYSKMQTAISSHSDFGGYTQITYDDYQSLIETDVRYAEAIKYQNGVMVLNGEKHDEITAKILEETRTMALHEKQTILMSEEYQKLKKQMEDGLLTEGDDLQRLYDLEAQIKGYDVLAKEIDSATSAYYRWLNRKGDDGMDRYSQAQEAYELINSTLNDSESEYYGRIGREEFGLGVDFILGENIELNTPEFDAAMKKAKRYLTEGAEGATAFYDDLVSAGLMDATTGVMHSTIAEISEALGISEEMVRTMIDRVNEYQEEANKIQVTEPEVDASETESALKQVITDLESANKYITEISETPLLIVIQNEEATLTGLTTLKDALESIMNNLKTILQSPASFNTDELKTAVQSILSYMVEMSASLESVNDTDLDIDGSNSENTLNNLKEAADTVVTSITAIDNVLKAVIASRDNINGQGINISTGQTSSLLGGVAKSLSSIIDKLNQIKKNSNITVRINEVTTQTTKTSGGSIWSKIFGGSGTSSVRGTAMAAGGNTLVGELGMETVVDPATNTWYTVGEHGAEFVKLPKDAIVFNHKQTEELFGGGKTDSRGNALASGNARVSVTDIANGFKKVISSVGSAVSGVISGAVSSVKSLAGSSSKSDSTKSSGTTMSGVSSKKNDSSSGGSSGSGSSKEDKLEKLKEQYEELNKQTEHLIEHQEFLYTQAEKGLDYSGMEQSLQKQAELYKKIMSDSQAAVSAMIAAGASDTDEELQAMEEAYWSAYRSLYDKLDQINALYVDALNDKIDGIQEAYSNLKAAAEEFNNGGISVDTFQALIDNGVQYMSLLENVNGQYVINTEGIQRMIAAQKEQLAIESALSYLQKLQTALTDKDTNAVTALVDMTETLSNSTWNAVYAQAALLRGSGGLSETQYAQVIANIDAIRDIAAAVNTDITSAAQEQSDNNDDQIDALEKILSLTEDLIKAEAEERIDAIEDEIDAYQKIIDLKKESLKASKEENDYTKNVAEKTAEIAKVQARIDQLRLDDSREARAECAKLEEELADLQSDLGDLQSDYSYDRQEEALDRVAQEFEDSRQQEIDAIESSISSAEKLYQAALERLNTGWDTLYDELIEWNTEMGSSLNSEITENWLAAAEAVKLYGSYLQAVNGLKQPEESETSTSSSNIVATGTPTVIPAATTVVPSQPKSEPEATETEPVVKVKVLSGKWNVRTGPSTSKKILGTVKEGTTLEYRGETSGDWYAVTYQGKDAWISKKGSKLIEELPKYHGGGVAGGEATLKDNEVLSVLEEGELVLTDKMKKAAYKLIDFKDYLEKKLGTTIGSISSPLPQLPTLAGVGALENSGVDIGQMNFSPTIQVEINHSGTMTDKDARQFGRTIADTAMNELYEGFRQRGIGKIFGTRPTK